MVTRGARSAAKVPGVHLLGRGEIVRHDLMPARQPWHAVPLGGAGHRSRARSRPAEHKPGHPSAGTWAGTALGR